MVSSSAGAWATGAVLGTKCSCLGHPVLRPGIPLEGGGDQGSKVSEWGEAHPLPEVPTPLLQGFTPVLWMSALP